MMELYYQRYRFKSETSAFLYTFDSLRSTTSGISFLHSLFINDSALLFALTSLIIFMGIPA
jgi:hypothetical protein